jgi:hypothetical protein
VALSCASRGRELTGSNENVVIEFPNQAVVDIQFISLLSKR